MKLFRSLLVAPAALGLLSPSSVTAGETNLIEVSSYSSSKEVRSIQQFNPVKEIAVTKKDIDRSEIQLTTFEAGSFSETTTMSGSASFQVGAVEQGDRTEAVTATYAYDIDLNTSINGEDNLYIGIEAGNGGSDFSGANFVLDSSNSGGDTLKVTSLYYQFPLGSWQIATGTLLDVDDLMPTTTSTYSDEFFLGGYSGLKSNYYVTQGTGSGIAVAKIFDNGLNLSGSIIGTGASTRSGFLTKEGIDVLTLSLGYDATNFGGGIIYSKSDSLCNLVDNLLTNACNELGITGLIDEGYINTSIGGYWRPTNRTTLSATTNLVNVEAIGLDIDHIADFQFGVDHEIENGVLSASWRTYPFYKIPDLNENKIAGDEIGSYVELYYTHNINDSLQIKPGITITLPTDHASTTTTDDVEFYLLDWTAIGVEAAFKF